MGIPLIRDPDTPLQPDERVLGTFALAEVGEIVAALQEAGIDARILGSLRRSATAVRHNAQWYELLPVAVPASTTAEAETVVRAWRRQGEARVRRHLRDLPRDLLRIAAVIAALVAIPLASRGAWRTEPLLFWAMVALAACGLLAEGIRRHRRRRRETASSPGRRDGHVDRGTERTARTG